MSDILYPWKHERRFNTYSNYFKSTFGERVQKVSVDAGFTCPNRDGSISKGGCTYCNNDAFSPSYCMPQKSVKQQILEGIEFHKKRYRRANKYLAYFQAYSNTYAPLELLQKLYDEALEVPGIIGLVIGTRPDCIDEEKLEYFSHLSKTKYLILEYGLESCYNKTLDRINRQHSFEQSVEAIEATAGKGIRTGAHLIFGLPGETRDEMLAEAGIISTLPLNNVKFHQLQIIKGTIMAREYELNPDNFSLFSWEEYREFMVDFLERLNPDFVVERITGEAPPRFISGPRWGLKRTDQILGLFEQRLLERNTWQGRLYSVQNA
ncbi:MAG: TIGR01212 family radical SAM protein [Bacteroidales bacterium]|nr:TIGR01212 family radical SAM protein [Bacteroidales bacterium]